METVRLFGHSSGSFTISFSPLSLYLELYLGGKGEKWVRSVYCDMVHLYVFITIPSFRFLNNPELLILKCSMNAYELLCHWYLTSSRKQVSQDRTILKEVFHLVIKSESSWLVFNSHLYKPSAWNEIMKARLAKKFGL